MLRTPLFETKTEINENDLKAFEKRLAGDLFQPNDPGYDDARQLWNGAVDKHPALIVRCQTTQDVAHAITFARTHDLPLAVRAGGHNAAGLALNNHGLVVDLSHMKNIEIDPVRRVARAQPGLTIREFTAALQPYGLLTPTGTCGGTGIAGSTLGGGIGWLTGKYGLAVDNVLSFELVTADGRVLNVSAVENADLFWSLRGGGGNFGIVTRFEYRLHPVGKVLAGAVFHPLSNGEAVMRFYRDFSGNAPDEVIAYCALTTIPGIGPAISLSVCYCGDDPAEGERLLAPMRQFGPPLVDLIRLMDYTDLIAMLDPTAPDGRHYADTAYGIKNLTDAALDAILASARESTSPFNSIVIHHVNGAGTRVAPDATAFALREPHYAIVNGAGWEEGSALPHRDWANAALARMQPFIDIALYVNFMGVGRESDIRATYKANYARLVALKNKFDPENVFRFNQNIQPE